MIVTGTLSEFLGGTAEVEVNRGGGGIRGAGARGGNEMSRALSSSHLKLCYILWGILS